MTLAVGLELALVAGALTFGSVGTIVAIRGRAAAHAASVVLRLARARETSFVESSRRLADAARSGADAVRAELTRGATVTAPGVDGVLVYEPLDGTLACVCAWGDRVAYYAGSRVALDDTTALPARALAARHRVTLADDGVRALHPGDAAALAIPLAVDADCACVVVFASRGTLDPESCDRLVTLAEHAAPAYLLALERERDRERAEYDGLTGLLTPRAFRARLAHLVERARVSPAARLALVFVDTDRFKEWNDAYGHPAGDALLRELAGVLRSAVRFDDDLVARNGGDEFCLVFNETSKGDAIERAEALRRRIGAIDVGPLRPQDAQIAVRISASIGVAAYPLDATDANRLLERADAAMYHSKRSGRDGVSYVDVGGGFSRLAEAGKALRVEGRA